MGDGIKKVMAGEDAVAKKLRKSVVSKVAIPKGTVVTWDMLCAKGPGDGILPCDAEIVVGKKALVDIEPDTVLSLDTLA